MKNIIKTVITILIILQLFTVTAYAGGEVTFYHTDPAGTPLAISDSSGNIVWKADYKPFGEEQIVTATTENDKMFVGKEKDKETGLYYFGARYMQDRNARFVSVDPVGPVDERSGKVNEKMLLDPQKLNRYSYAINNPYRYIDPDGKFAVAIHRQMTISTLTNRGFSQRAAERVAQGNAYVDRATNQLTNYQHAMRDAGESRETAIKVSKQFMQTKLSQAASAFTSGDYERGLFVFGEGLHTAQDQKHNWITLLQHGSDEFRTDSNPTDQQRSTGLATTQGYVSELWSVLRNDYKLSGTQIEKIRTDLQKY